jgi:hypothetical protein
MLGFGNDDEPDYGYGSFQNPFQNDFNVYGYPEDGLQFADVLKQLTGGFVQGFTTLDLVEEEPDHWLESLARGAGYFAGFVGIIPGAGTLVSFGTKAGVRGTVASVNLLSKVVGKEVAETAITQSLKGLRHITQPVVTKYAIQTRSVPFYAADAIMGLGKKMLANTPAEKLVQKMLTSSTGKRVLVEDIAEASIRMGLASGVASWQGGIDQMMSSFVSGAAFGGLDRGIGSLAGKIAKDSQAVRAITGMMANGLPSTLTGQPLEIQIFDYLLGAWFGTELPYAQRKALEVLTGPSGVTSDGKRRYEALLNPEENIPEYKNAEALFGNKADDVREEILNQSRNWLGSSMGQSKSGYASQMLAAAWFKEKYNPLFDKYRAEGKSAKEADQLAKDDIRKSDEVLNLIKTNEQIENQIASGVYTDADGNVDLTQASDAQRKMMKMTTTFVRSSSNKKVDGSIPRDLSNAELVDFTEPVEEPGFSLEKLIQKINSADAQRIADSMEQTGERIDEALIQLEPRADEPISFEGITPEAFGINAKDAQLKVGGDINGDIVQRVDDPLDRSVVDDSIPIATDVVPLQTNPKVKTPSKEAIESTTTVKIDDPGLVLDSIKTAKEDARQDIDPLQQKNLTPIEYVARDFVVKDISIPLDKREEVYAQIIKDATVDYDNYIAGNIKSVNSKSEFADYFVDKYGKNLKLLEKERKEYASRIVQTIRKMDNAAINQYVVDPANKKLRNRNELSGNGTSILVSRAPGQDARVLGKLGKNVYSIRYVENVRKGKVDTFDPPEGIMKYFKTSDDMLWIHHNMMREGKAFMGHVKSNGELIYYDAIDIKTGEGSYEGYIQRSLNEIDDKSYMRYKGAKQKYIEKVFDQAYKATVTDPAAIQKTKEDIGKVYDKYVVSQIKLHTEVFNPGLKLADISKKGFVNNFLSMNKRMQLIHSEGHWADKKEFLKIKKSPESKDSIDGFRYMILSSANKPTKDGVVISKKEGVPDDFFNVLENGKIKKVISETSTDGAVIVRQDVFDAMVADGGYDPNAGVIKSVIAGDENSGRGMLLSKHAMFRAGKAQDEFMKNNNVHMILRDTSAKQYGTRKVFDSQLREDGTLQLYNRGTDEPVALTDPDVVYEMPIDVVSYNLSTREDINSALSNQVIVSQLLRNLHVENAPKDFINDLYKETIQASIEGDDVSNQKYSEIASQVMFGGDDKLAKKLLEKVDVDKLGLQQITNIIYGGDGGPLVYDHVIRHILSKDIKEDPTAFVDDAEFINRNLSGAERIVLSLSDTNVVFDSAMIANKNLDGYVSAKLLSYYNSRINSPEVEYSLKSIGLPTDEFNRGLINEGEFMLAEGAKDMKVKSKALGEDTTLGKLWDAYNDTKAKNKDGSYNQRMLDLEEDLRMVVIRVPADSVSGARSLLFKGFYDNRGTGIALHSKDMASLGGMDLDIDSTFVYQNLGKGEYGKDKQSLHDVLLANKDQWVKKADAKDISADASKDQVDMLKQVVADSKTIENMLYKTLGVTYTNDKNRPCALEGIRANVFTRGSSWEIVKDLSGYPSHKGGGVDVKIGSDGVSIVKGDSVIKATYGLLIPMTVDQV